MSKERPRLLQPVSQELQQPFYVLVPHEYRHPAQRATSLPPRQLPVYPPDLVGVPEADLGRLPPDGEESLVPYPPDPTRLQPLGELLGLGQVTLRVAGRLLPLLRGFDAGTGA